MMISINSLVIVVVSMTATLSGPNNQDSVPLNSTNDNRTEGLAMGAIANVAPHRAGNTALDPLGRPRTRWPATG